MRADEVCTIVMFFVGKKGRKERNYKCHQHRLIALGRRWGVSTAEGIASRFARLYIRHGPDQSNQGAVTTPETVTRPCRAAVFDEPINEIPSRHYSNHQ